MDATDVAILRKLTWKPFDPRDAARRIHGVWDVARELEVHGNTVKRRLARMHEQGILHGIHLLPEIGLMGLDAGLYEFRFANAREKLIGMDHLNSRWATQERPGTLDTYTFVGNLGWAGVVTHAGDDLDSFAEDLGKEAGAVECRMVEHRGWDVDHDAVTDLDRRIMRVLHMDALRPLVDVAEEVGVTPRTVRTRLRRLAAVRAFMILPYFSPARIEGLIPFMLVARTSGPEPANALFNELPEAIYRSTATARRPHLVMAAVDSQEMDEMVVRAETVAGVADVEARLLQGSTSCPPECTPMSPIHLLDEGWAPVPNARSS